MNVCETSDKAERLIREQEFHDDAFSSDLRECTQKYYALTEVEWSEYRRLVREAGTGSRILEYGCGPYGLVDQIAPITKSAHAIDISPVAIQKTQEKAEKMGVKVEARVMDCENLEFEDDSLDLIFGCSILHHLDLELTFAEMRRVLRPGGTVIFIEPLGTNPLINLYRELTPRMRTEDEHPFVEKDLEMFRNSFDEVRFDFFHLSTFAAVPFGKTAAFPKMRDTLNSFDQFVFSKLPYSRKFAWMSLLQATV